MQRSTLARSAFVSRTPSSYQMFRTCSTSSAFLPQTSTGSNWMQPACRTYSSAPLFPLNRYGPSRPCFKSRNRRACDFESPIIRIPSCPLCFIPHFPRFSGQPLCRSRYSRGVMPYISEKVRWK